MKLVYKGWAIHVFEQAYHPDYLKFVALATREKDGIIVGFNKDGATENEALQRVKDKIGV